MGVTALPPAEVKCKNYLSYLLPLKTVLNISLNTLDSVFV